MKRLLEWKVLNTTSQSSTTASYKCEDFTDLYIQLIDKIKKSWSCSVIRCAAHVLEVNLAGGVFRRYILIQYDDKEKCFKVTIKDSNTLELIESLYCYGGFDVVLSVLIKNGIIKDKKLNEWVAMNNVSTSNKSSISHVEFAKIIKHLTEIYDCDFDRDLKYLYDTGFEISYGDQLEIYNLKIDFDNKTGTWHLLHTRTYPANKIVKNYSGVGFEHLINIMFNSKIIKDKTICESTKSSTIDEIKEYETLWSNSLIEWKAMNNNIANNQTQTSKANSSSKVVYAWDIYLDPRDKGSFCSAEKYNGVWDGMVYETEIEAEDAAWYHLQELENEGELSPDPNIYVEPSDYNIDVFTIPLSEISDAVLHFSNLDHLI